MLLKMLGRDDTAREVSSPDGDCLACVYVHTYCQVGEGVAFIEYPDGAVRRVQCLDDQVGVLLCTDSFPPDALKEIELAKKRTHEPLLLFIDDFEEAD